MLPSSKRNPGLVDSESENCPGEETILCRLSHWSLKEPNRTAFTFDETLGPVTELTYRELNRRSTTLHS